MSTGDFVAFTGAYGAFLAAMTALSDASLNMLRISLELARENPIYQDLASGRSMNRLIQGDELFYIEAPQAIDDRSHVLIGLFLKNGSLSHRSCNQSTHIPK